MPADSGQRPDSGPPPVIDAGRPDSGVPADIEALLSEVPGLRIETQVPLGEGGIFFVLRFEQPEDHQVAGGPRFEQRVLLRHRAQDRPMVLHTTGYDLFGPPLGWLDRESEPASLLSANELVVEHRFFGESMTGAPDWSKMTVAQSAADTHRIYEALASLYPEPWLGTGVSKGGMTSIFHHHHYPDDFEMIVPYVAPISFGLNDPRYLNHLETVGPPDGQCVAGVRALSREIIGRRVQIAAQLRATDPSLRAFGAEVIEVAVAQSGLGFEWGFWQYWGSPAACASLPSSGAPTEVIAQFAGVSAEQLMVSNELGLRPYSYQVAAELGGPAYYRADLIELVRGVDWSVLHSQPPPPWGADPRFDPRPMQQVDAWLRNEAGQVLGVYGAWDPWTGGMPTVRAANDSVLVIVPEVGHGAQMAMLRAAEKREAYARVEATMGFEVREARGVLQSPVITRHQRVVQAAQRAARRFGGGFSP